MATRAQIYDVIKVLAVWARSRVVRYGDEEAYAVLKSCEETIAHPYALLKAGLVDIDRCMKKYKEVNDGEGAKAESANGGGQEE